jgi:tripartite-type tricarboxylate transporter receptor subunit TctC
MIRRPSRRTALRALAAVPLLAAPARLRAQTLPTGNIRIVVGLPAGGLTDAFARGYGNFIGQALGRSVVVDNRPGASGALAAQNVLAAPADGLTLLFTISTTFFGARVLIRNLRYDPDKDFSVVSIVPAGHLPLVVRPNLPVSSVRELLAYAERNDVSIGTYGAGSFPHVMTDALNRSVGRKMEPVHYRGEAPMWTDLAGGRLHAACGSYLAASAVLASGAGRVVAVPTARRMRRLPEVATFAEQGFTAPVFGLVAWVGMFAPSGVPEPILDRYGQLMVEGAGSEPIMRLRETNAIDEGAMPRGASKALYDAEGPVWVEAVRALGLTPE